MSSKKKEFRQLIDRKETVRIRSSRSAPVHACTLVIDWKSLLHFLFSLLFALSEVFSSSSSLSLSREREIRCKGKRRRKFFHYAIVVTGVKVPSVCCRHSLATNETEIREKMRSVYLKNIIVRVCRCERQLHSYTFLISNYIWLRRHVHLPSFSF